MIADCRRRGLVCSVPDAVIAATALRYGLTLVTLKAQDFSAFSGVSVYPLPEPFE